MTELPKLTEIERLVFVECAEQLAIAVRKHCTERQRGHDGFFWSGCDSSWEMGCLRLEDIGLLESNADGAFVWIIEQDDIREFLSMVEPPVYWSLKEIICSFVDLHSFHGLISEGRKPFDVEGRLQPAMWSLVQAGYATREPAGFRWTDKLATIMIEAGLWDLEERPSWDEDAPIVEHVLADKIWKTIPLWRRLWLAYRIVGMRRSEFHDYILKRWTGEKLAYFETQPRGSDKRWYFFSPDFPDAVNTIIDRLLAIRRGESR